MTEEKRQLVCVPFRGESLSEFAPGSTFTHTCILCGQNVSVAPSSLKYLVEYPDTEIVCVLCFEPQADETHEVVPGSMQEVADHLKKRAH